ncbi:MAG: DEAD/DEAH box helicase [Clostridium sp.]|nr:DEAD/DEAH box helicase [Clostridium sp.]
MRRKQKEEKEAYENMGKNIITELKELDAPKEKVKLEVFLTKYDQDDFFEVSFKIGNKKMYVLKSISDFINARSTNKELNFGKEFTYSSNRHTFAADDEALCDYMEECLINQMYSESYKKNFVKGKLIFVSSIFLRRFLLMLKGREITLNDEKFKVIEEDIQLNFQLKQNKDKYLLDMVDKYIAVLTPKNDVFIYNGGIYLPSKRQMKVLEIFLRYISKYNSIEFKKENEIEMFNTAISKLENAISEVKIDENIENLVKEELKAEFYLDLRKNQVVLNVNLKYGNETLKFYANTNKNDKIIIRDNEKEIKILDILNELNFYYDNDIFKFNGDDEELYLFLKEKYKQLEELGEVYYSDRFKERKVYISPKITAGINDTGNNYLEFNFHIEDINPLEYKKILEAVRSKRKYYKLKNNSFINLEEKEINDFLELVDSIDSKNKDGNIKLSKNKAVIVSDYLKEKELSFVKGKEIIDDISKKIINIDKVNYELPKELKAELRPYQITGFRWFKNLSYLGFGGVLADEMGLGKTVQTIAFLLSEKKKKSLIVAPTSLIYNWKNEFKKFAPTMKICVLHGEKDERQEMLNDVKIYDVILTTYGTLKNDEDKYEKLKFDYCILDEGQNIKNPLAQSTKSVKNIKAENKFILTGTPIENNLIELWSIFDFIMPGYLDNVHNFKNRFINKENTAIELQKYIKPFMLRRLKKDVIRELPEKIEKNYYVELTKEQKKVYASYVKDIKEKMENDEFSDDKITIFSYLTKLRQLCLDPFVVLDDYNGKSGKIEEAVSIIENNVLDNHKILLFSQFTSVLKNISKRLCEKNIKHFYLDGSTNAGKRMELVEQFNNNDETKVFLISLKAGGTGLNLTSADIVIHFDPWWNPAVEDQATDRAHRIGQENVVQVFKLISEGTVEDKILSLQEKKKQLIKDVLDSDYKHDNILGSLSKEELIELFE